MIYFPFFCHPLCHMAFVLSGVIYLLISSSILGTSVQGAASAWAQEGQEELLHIQGQEG